MDLIVVVASVFGAVAVVAVYVAAVIVVGQQLLIVPQMSTLPD